MFSQTLWKEQALVCDRKKNTSAPQVADTGFLYNQHRGAVDLARFDEF
jgi:hypothetical protein